MDQPKSSTRRTLIRCRRRCRRARARSAFQRLSAVNPTLMSLGHLTPLTGSSGRSASTLSWDENGR